MLVMGVHMEEVVVDLEVLVGAVVEDLEVLVEAVEMVMEVLVEVTDVSVVVSVAHRVIIDSHNVAITERLFKKVPHFTF